MGAPGKYVQKTKNLHFGNWLVCFEIRSFMKPFKISLVITPSRAKLEKGFPVLTLLSTKLGKTSNTSDKLMQLISLGPHSDWGK